MRIVWEEDSVVQWTCPETGQVMQSSRESGITPVLKVDQMSYVITAEQLAQAEFMPGPVIDAAALDYVEVLCCCDPENFIGMLPKQVGLNMGLELRETTDGEFAFNSEGNENRIRNQDSFVPASRVFNRKKGTKTWRKATDIGSVSSVGLGIEPNETPDNLI